MTFEYNHPDHVRSQLTLRSGRRIQLEALEQEMTYAGRLGGVPQASGNEWRIKSSLKAAERRCRKGTKPHLIPPIRRDFLREPGDMRKSIEAHPFPIIPEWLPMVSCIGSFKSPVIAQGHGNDISVLVVVWFQNEYGPPILEPALEQILNLDWDSLATDIDIT